MVPTPVGDVNSSYDLTADALTFDSDGIWNAGRVSVPWSAILEAGTATVGMPVGRGAPDLGRYVPAKLEWLVASRADASAPFMRQLPPPPDRDAVIAAVRARLGPRWVGENIPLEQAQKRFRLPVGGETFKTVGLVIGVLVLLFLLLLAFAFLLTPIVLFPAGFVFGIWLFREGLAGFRDAISVANTPTSRVAAAAIGLVELEGLAKTAQPTLTPITGRPSVFWDVGVDAYSSDRDNGGWRQLAARHGGAIDVVHIADQTGDVPVWLHDATLLLEGDVWESDRDALPPAGMTLLDELGFPWTSNRLRVRETRLEVDAPVYILGTLDERRSIPGPGELGLGASVMTQFRTGRWRSTLIRALPPFLGQLVAVLLGFLSIVTGVGRGGERPKYMTEPKPPDLPPATVLVWKGLAGRPFIVSNRREHDAVDHLRTRSLYKAGAGIAVVCYVLYELLKLVF